MEKLIHRFLIFLALALTLWGPVSCAMGGTEVGNPTPPVSTGNSPTGEIPASTAEPDTQPCDEENPPTNPEEDEEDEEDKGEDEEDE